MKKTNVIVVISWNSLFCFTTFVLLHSNHHRPKIKLTNSTCSKHQYTCTRPYISQNRQYPNNFRIHILDLEFPSGAASLAPLSLRRTRNRTGILYRGRFLNALHKHNCRSSNKSLNENAAGLRWQACSRYRDPRQE